MIEAGQVAPAFSLPNQDGETISLADFKGKWLILYFYPKDDTPGCTKEACDFTSLYGEFNELDAEIVGVSPDSSESHQKFISKYNLSFSLLSDSEKEVMKAYGAWGMKKNYGREYEGVIRSTIVIDPEGRIAHAWHNVKATGHAARVRREFESIQEATA